MPPIFKDDFSINLNSTPRMNIMTFQLFSVLDRTNVSTTKANIILGTGTDGFGVPVEKVNLYSLQTTKKK